MINCILQPSKEQVNGMTPYLHGTRMKVISKSGKHSHLCNVWGHIDSAYNGARKILTKDLLKMNLITTQL